MIEDKKTDTLLKRLTKKFNKEQYEKLNKVVSFLLYLDMVIEKPSLAMLAHERVYKMIESHGSETYEINGEKKTRYKLFSDKLFGIDEPIAEMVDYFRSSAERLDTRKRILLFHGPVSGAKSTIATILKAGLEQYTATDEGELYALAWPTENGTLALCSNLDDPLKFLPEEERQFFLEKHNIYVEGLPCPQCRKQYRKLEEKHKGDILSIYKELKCKRVVISEQNRLGIGTFSPADKKSQDQAELVGGINFKTLPSVGSEADPDGWTFNGELNCANRGMVEFIEMFKADERFLHILLTLAQERRIKTPRFPLISADEVVLGHTNENEYTNFLDDPTREALKDRMIKVDFKYNLIVSQEEKIYDRLLSEEAKKNTKHRAPNTLKVAALFGVLTRMEEWEKGDLLTKAKLYDGQVVNGFKEKDFKEMKEKAKRDGFGGVSPRLLVNILSEAITMDDIKCLSPFVVMKNIFTALKKHKFPNIDPKKQEEHLNLLDIVRKEYQEMAKKDVLKAFLESYGPAMEDLCGNYIDHIQAFVQKSKLKDPVTGEEIDPDESLMRSIEERIENVSDSRREQFRGSLLASIGSIMRKGEKFTYKSDERLRKAIEKKIFDDNKGNIRFTTFSGSKTDETNLKKLEAIQGRMISELDYCKECSRDVMNYIGGLLAKGDVNV